TPSMTIQRIAGSGDVWLVEGVNTYGNGEVFHIAQHLRLRDGRVWQSTTYFAAPFEAPAWRAGIVERIK
ncbi:MAG: nuclear transport factor 2 family protein, partial [Chloroflexota bacterium]